MNYADLKQTFWSLKRISPKKNLTAHIIFTEDSFAKHYPLLSRTYRFDSDNKAFWPNVGGYPIFAYCLDGTDQGVRLDWYMAEEGNPGGWTVEGCYILEQMWDAAAILGAVLTEQGDGTVCYFFGDTRIRARESRREGRICLEPVAGAQAARGEWAELPMYPAGTVLESGGGRVSRKPLPAEEFEPSASETAEVTEIDGKEQGAILRFTDVGSSGKPSEAKELHTCYGDLYVIVNALRDYANLLEGAVIIGDA